jgi:hypothetical protein
MTLILLILRRFYIEKSGICVKSAKSASSAVYFFNQNLKL